MCLYLVRFENEINVHIYNLASSLLVLTIPVMVVKHVAIIYNKCLVPQRGPVRERRREDHRAGAGQQEELMTGELSNGCGNIIIPINESIAK